MAVSNKIKLDTLAKAIMDNPDKDPRRMIAQACKTDEDYTYLDQRIQELEREADRGAQGTASAAAG